MLYTLCSSYFSCVSSSSCIFWTKLVFWSLRIREHNGFIQIFMFSCQIYDTFLDKHFALRHEMKHKIANFSFSFFILSCKWVEMNHRHLFQAISPGTNIQNAKLSSFFIMHTDSTDAFISFKFDLYRLNELDNIL